MTEAPILEAALRLYGIRDAAIERLPGGMVNENFRISAAGKTFVLKRYADSMREFEPEVVNTALAIQEMARTKGVPAPRVVPAIGGGLWAESGGRLYCVTEFIEGRQFKRGEMPAACARSMGEALHAVFEALADLPVEPAPVQPFPPPEALAARFGALLRLATSRPTADVKDEAAAAILRDRLARVESWRGPVPSVQPHWTHGDYQDSNVIFDEQDRVVGIIDWDVLGVRSRSYEVMRGFALSFPDGIEGGLEYLRGYVDAARLDPAEASAMVDLWDYASVARVWPIDVKYESPEIYQPRWDEFIHPPSGWWTRNKEKIRSHLQHFAAEVAR